MVRRGDLVRFLLWTLGIKVCGVVGGPIDQFALWFERRTERECWIYACRLHPEWLLPPYNRIPESWWERTGWKKGDEDG